MEQYTLGIKECTWYIYCLPRTDEMYIEQHETKSRWKVKKEKTPQMISIHSRRHGCPLDVLFSSEGADARPTTKKGRSKPKSLSCIYSFCILMVLLFLSNAGIASAENTDAEPIHIEADRMESDHQQEVVVFLGHVVAKQGTIVIQADKMTVHYTTPENEQSRSADTVDVQEQNPGGNNHTFREKSDPESTPLSGNMTQRIKVLFAQGNVKIIKEDWVAIGNSMEYFSGEKKVVLSGNAQAWQDKNMVTGDTIVLYLDEDRSVVERGGKEGNRVKAYIYPDGKPDAEKQE